ncbi:MAG: glycosyltransferase [Candidatus Omnitrophica bacterium]|nr:glycosyltransferase [Candidatus Omnitrophota bacterium]
MSMPARPLVSVVIPTFNRAAMLREALESVFHQTVKSFEVIVVDDGSTDDTSRVVKSFAHGIVYLRQENQGVAAARNSGIKAAKGRYIAFLDSDDLWLPHKLERQIDYLRAHPDVGLLYARMWSYRTETPQERRLDPHVVARTFADLVNGPNAITTSTVMMRRECVQVVGLFNPALRGTEDHEFWLRVARRFSIAFLDEPLAEYRRHGKSINGDPIGLYDAYRRLYEIIWREYRRELRDPRAAERQLAKFEYLCGTTALKRGDRRRALKLIRTALARDAALGQQFVKKDTPWHVKVWLPIKPYAALTVSALQTLGRN